MWSNTGGAYFITLPEEETNLIISSDNIDNINCKHLTVSSDNEFILNDLNLNDNDNYINIESYLDGTQALIFNTNYNNTDSNQINFTVDYNDIDLLGDLNYDNQINIIDIVFLVNMILDDEFNILADLNEDSMIDILDVILLVNIILNFH